VTAPGKVRDGSYVVSSTLVSETKELAVASREQHCMAVFQISNPAQQPTAARLSRRSAGQHLQMTCDASKLCRNSNGIPLNINTAKPEEFAQFYSKGWVDPSALIKWRTAHGPLQRLEDLYAEKPAEELDAAGNPVLERILSKVVYERVKGFLSVHAPRPCETDAHCAAWDEYSCFTRSSVVEQEAHRAHTVRFSPDAPEAIYVSSEDQALVAEMSLVNGSATSTTPILGQYATGLALDSSPHKLGPCEVDKLTMLKFCRHPNSEGTPVQCSTEEHCHTYGLQAFVAVEQLDTQGGQIFRSPPGSMRFGRLWRDGRTIPKTEFARQITDGLRLLLYNGVEPVLGSFLSDKALHMVPSMQVHPVLGLLIAQGQEIRRCDKETGQFLHVLLKLTEGSEISDFHVW